MVVWVRWKGAHRTALHLLQTGWMSACGGECPRRPLTVKVSQSGTALPSAGQRVAQSSLVQSSLVGLIQKSVCAVDLVKGWAGEKERLGGGDEPAESVLLCADTHWTLTNIHTRRQKGHCALNTDVSSLTSESFSKCHLAPERQSQQRELSSKEHLGQRLLSVRLDLKCLTLGQWAKMSH